jgi:hypothetical protein
MFATSHRDKRFTFTRPDIFAIGFQEIVPLTAQQIVQTDPEKRSVLPEEVMHELMHVFAMQTRLGKQNFRDP